jgi:hypothetical protein
VKIVRIVLHSYGFEENKRDQFEFRRDHFDALLNDDAAFLNNCSTEFESMIKPTPILAMKVLFASIRDMRKRGIKNLSKSEMDTKGYKIQRLAYLTEFEFAFVYALHC